MFLIEVIKQKPRKSVAFCFGRMNPPTIGHARLINATARAAQGGDYWIFLSHTQDSKKNPLDYNTKVDFVKSMFPQHADHVSYGSLRTIMEIMEFLYHHNYTDVTYVCGNDRLPAFKELLNKYNGAEGGKTYYKFNSINVVSSGPRDPDEEDAVAGASATGARAAAEQGEFEQFKQITGSGRYAKQLYRAVRKGLLLEESSIPPHAPKGADWDRLPAWKKEWYRNWKGGLCKHPQPYHKPRWWDDESVTECSGYIPKNKKEAKDPRWSNALTVDVHPDTPTKNLKAFKLI